MLDLACRATPRHTKHLRRALALYTLQAKSGAVGRCEVDAGATCGTRARRCACARGTAAGAVRCGREDRRGPANGEFERVSTYNGSEFRNRVFDAELARLGARHTLISPGGPQSNGFVERVQHAILEECWEPSFVRCLAPKYMGLRREVVRHLEIYNHDRAQRAPDAWPDAR